jgi:hypothetical protein
MNVIVVNLRKVIVGDVVVSWDNKCTGVVESIETRPLVINVRWNEWDPTRGEDEYSALRSADGHTIKRLRREGEILSWERGGSNGYTNHEIYPPKYGEQQPREHSVPCALCRKPTLNHSAICTPCGGLKR